MEMSPSISAIAEALAKAQAVMRHATKDSTNPHFKSKYADLASVLEAIKEPFQANGLSLSQHPGGDGDRITVTTILMHKSGEHLKSTLTLIPTKKDPQGAGSAITYARRYAAMAVAGLAADDDDGNAASQPVATRPERTYKGSDEDKRALAKLLGELGLDKDRDGDAMRSIATKMHGQPLNIHTVIATKLEVFNAGQ